MKIRLYIKLPSAVTRSKMDLLRKFFLRLSWNWAVHPLIPSKHQKAPKKLPYKGCSIQQISLRAEDSTSTLVFLRNASRGTTFVWSIRQNISLSNVWRSKSREMSKKRTQFERGKSKLEILNFHRLLFGSLWKNFGRPDFWNSLIMGPPGLSMVSVATLNITL